MRMVLPLGLMLTVVASCAIGAPRWITPGAHVVDGYWLAEERPCPVEGGNGLDCGDAVTVAKAALMAEEPTAVVKAAWAAQAAEAWLDSEGNDHGKLRMRTQWDTHIVLELEDGRRRVFAALCPVGPPRQWLCQPMELTAYPVGGEPWK